MRINHSGQGIEPIICRRKTRFSADYELIWGDEKGEVLFESFRGGGGVVVSKTQYGITAKGPPGRVWSLANGDSNVLIAERRGLRSAIRIDGDEATYRLERKHMLGSEFRLTDWDEVLAEFEKPRPINGASEITVLDLEADFLTLCFAFWLVTTVRRASTGNL